MATEYPQYTRTFVEVYLTELDYIKKRRDNINLTSEQVVQESERVSQELDKCTTHEEKCSVTASTKAGLIGLALSGGGIRSATFNLGLFQALAKQQVLSYCDYLSTVSGGGYIGSCLSFLLANDSTASTKAEYFPLRDERESELTERKQVTYLRANKNYLGLSKGLFNWDNWHALGMAFAGALLTGTIPLAVILFLTWLLYIQEINFYGFFHIVPSLAFLAALLVVIIRWWQVLPWWESVTKQSCQTYDKIIAILTFAAVTLIAITLLSDFIYTWAWDWTKNTSTHPFYNIIFLLLGVSVIAIIGGRLFFYKNYAQQKSIKIIISTALIIFSVTLPTWLLSIMYLNEYKMITIYLSEYEQIEQQPSEMEKLTQFIELLINNQTVTSGPVIQKFNDCYFENEGYLDEVLKKASEQFHNNQSLGTQETLATIIPAITYLKESQLVKKIIGSITFLAIIILILIGIFTNINFNSLHDFYRNRLSKTFLKRVTADNQNKQPLLLKDLHQYHNGPYHLINTTLNVANSENPILRGRGADLFMFSKYYCGAESTGYQSSTHYNHGKTELATAMAISGAAASPEMGTSTNSFVAIVMALLNIRLNLWMPNPQRDRLSWLIFWPKYFWKELTRSGTETDTLLNLSDGGHHENLGIYPLLRRHCRIIIASDASADPYFQMENLANLQRKARIDLGIEIQFDNIDQLRPDPQNQGYTKVHFIIGTITYPNQERGILLYIKTSLTGTEPEDILAYRRKNPRFPDQTTANQFFNEDQFESYRKLGKVVGEEIFMEKLPEIPDVERFFDELAKLKVSHAESF